MDGLPARFGKYTLIRKLATGGMAELFLAIQKSVAGFEKLIVIKRILPAMNNDKAFIEMLLHEARVAATLSHPNIVQTFDVGQVDGTYFIAMEHVHGEDLRSIVRQMKRKGVVEFPLEHALSIILGMCAGLAYAHEKRDLDGTALNIVHRDISPQNTVVTFSGDVKIVDFGIAKSDSKGGEGTKSGKLKGKVPYMSPEQARGELLDSRSDIFAVGVMLFELTTGKRLFKGPSEYETLKLICERDYPLPSQVRPGYPPELEAIVMRALAKDPAQRFQTARAMQGALEEFVRRERIAVSTIALSHFMHGLFEEKLASQKEALLQGKQLADIIESQQPPPPQDSLYDVDANRGSSSGLLSTPAASRTVTDLAVERQSKRRGPMVAAVGSAALLVFAGIVAVYAVRGAGESAAPAAAVVVEKGSLAITSTPAGAAIWIDGDLRPETTPATITGLPVDRDLDIKLTKDGFEQARETVRLAADGSVRDLGLELREGAMSIEVAIKPQVANATLTLDGQKQAGFRVENLRPGTTHRLVVSAPGYSEHAVTFSGHPFEKKTFDVVLEKLVEAPSRASAAHIARSVAAPAPAAAGGVGKLNVSAAGGWCNVTVDGSAKGPTPVAGIELPAGPHKVTCAAESGPSQTATVVVAPGETARYRFSLAP
jgi:serine/threonine-protein kinase